MCIYLSGEEEEETKSDPRTEGKVRRLTSTLPLPLTVPCSGSFGYIPTP